MWHCLNMWGCIQSSWHDCHSKRFPVSVGNNITVCLALGLGISILESFFFFYDEFGSLESRRFKGGTEHVQSIGSDAPEFKNHH
jgi:hypothetical protein